MTPAAGLAARGEAAMDRYGETGEPSYLDSAIGLLAEALAVEPDHPKALSWHWHLIVLHRERGRPADRDVAVELADTLVLDVDPNSPIHDPAVVMLAQLLWERVEHDADPAEADQRLTMLAGLDHGPVARAVLRGCHGLVVACSAELTGSGLDRARALDLLEESASMLSGYRPEPDDWAWAELDEWLPGLFADSLAWAYAERDRDPSDLDRAVDVITAELPRYAGRPGPYGALAGTLGRILAVRADRRADAADAGRAAELLAAGAAAREDPAEAAELWAAAAAAARRRWELGGDLDALERAADHTDRVIASADADADEDLLLIAYGDRFFTEHFLRQNGRLRAGRAGGAFLIVEITADARRVLDRAIRADPDTRARFAGLLAVAEICCADVSPGRFDPIGVRALIELARTARPPDPVWITVLDLLTGVLELHQGILDPRPSAGYGIATVSAAEDGGDPELRERLRELLMLAVQVRGSLTGDRRDGLAARRLAGRTRQWQPLDRTSSSLADPSLLLLIDVLAQLERGDHAGGGRTIRAAGPSATEGDFGDYLRYLAAVTDPLSGPGLTLDTREDFPAGMLGPTALALAFTNALAVFLQNLVRGDRPAAVVAAERVERLIDLVPPGLVHLRSGSVAQAGALRLTLADTTTDPDIRQADADRAVAHFQVATELTGPADPRWTRMTTGFGAALRLCSAPDRPRSRALTLAALQGHAWQVFAQAGTEHAMAVAKAAATDADRLIHWCLDDLGSDPSAVDDLIAALDGARGLVLRAAGASRLVPDQLRERNQPDLAAEWEATAGLGRSLGAGGVPAAGEPPGIEVSDQLRQRVLNTFGEQDVTGSDRVTVDEIQATLAVLDHDALVYLVGGEPAGAAVVVPADGPPRVLRLPGLTASWASRYAHPVRAGRDLGLAEPDAARPTDLERLCERAWDAVMGLLIAAEPGRRIVLVAMGELSVVPWHAAFRRTGDRREYAIEHLVVSYSPAARSLRGLGRSDGAAVRSALVVGNPTGDLPAAGDEAYAVHESFYPAGTYFGRPAGAAPGAPDDVLDWVAGQPAGAAVLHFACHGAADPERPAEARLILAGGDLSARTLLDRTRTAAIDVDRVFLAACTTGVPGEDFDEAFSLATSFLAAGARTVFGSLWRVPDQATSLLMYMLHHHLRAGCDPADALHRAQLWMLEKNRDLPAGTPDRLRHHHRPDEAAELASWAGFIHFGA